MSKGIVKNKAILFKENEKIHADLKLKLDYEGISQSHFFRHMIQLVLNEDPRMMSILADYRVANGVKTKVVLENIEAEKEKKKEKLNKFGISETDIESLYDMFDDEADYE
jgi:hypothetical protein